MYVNRLFTLIWMVINIITPTSHNWLVNVVGYNKLDEMREWLLDHSLSTTQQVENNMKISSELLESIEVSRVGKFVQDTTEDLNNVFELVKGSHLVDKDEMIDSYVDLFKDIEANVDMTSSGARNFVTQFYSNINLTNFRVSPIRVLKEYVPDFSPMFSLCSAFSETKCSKCSLPLVLCRLCCPDISETPITLADWALESRSSTSISTFLTSSFSLIGLQLVYQSWLEPRNPNNAATHSVIRFINKFKRHAGNKQFINASEVDSLSSLPASELCGYYVSGSRTERIVGGKNVNQVGTHPWQLSMATTIMGIWYQHRCGAAIITRNWALSAAHCVQSVGTLNPLYLMGGFLQISEHKTAQIRKVDRIVSHPHYNDVSFQQDIALLHMIEPLVFNTKIIPVCLPPPSSYYVGKMATLAGWGRLGDNENAAERLKYVGLPIISNDECMEWFNSSGSRQWIPYQTFLCAGWEEGMKDACSGDSGGPLTVTRDDARIEVAGVVSWGLGCGGAGRPGVYTRVTSFREWIDNIIGPT